MKISGFALNWSLLAGHKIRLEDSNDNGLEDAMCEAITGKPVSSMRYAILVGLGSTYTGVRPFSQEELASLRSSDEDYNSFHKRQFEPWREAIAEIQEYKIDKDYETVLDSLEQQPGWAEYIGVNHE